MAKQEVIPLDQKVRLRQDLTAEEYQAMQDRGFNYFRNDGVRHYSGHILVDIANQPVGLTLKDYQQSQGNYGGLVMYSIDKEQALAVRDQFADALETIPPEDLE